MNIRQNIKIRTENTLGKIDSRSLRVKLIGFRESSRLRKLTKIKQKG